ncbi:PIN domain-containing protein [Rickettsia canadensis]|uniref:Monovalent cation/H+ antiporter subunit D n=1 Tax=Rickettsia canadensis str. CA410 TaxID=1105107 RepID=A0ABM5MUK6_RICCA|nr:PIN domain-containing protein [Rickettsia canadensis]AFB21331.1 putative monovalent cation/H+ antiporter subunit D [Rickettsia canadensis str. CA410]
MGLIIDNSIFIALERGKINTKAWSNYDKAFISPITLIELLMGIDRVDNDNRRIKHLDFIEYVKSLFIILPFGIKEAYTYSRIIHNLYKANIAISTHNLLIAATAITNNCKKLSKDSRARSVNSLF